MLINHLPKAIVVLLCLLIGPTSLASESKILRIGGSGTDLSTFRHLSQKFKQHNQDIIINILPSLGSSGAVKALKDGKLDIGLLSRKLKNQEKDARFIAKHYARTALIFTVNKKSEIQSTNIKNIAAYYSGIEKYWPDGSVVRPILRPQSDSDMNLLRSVFPKLTRSFEIAYHRKGLPLAVTDQDSADKISRVPGAIGTSTLALILSENRPLKALKLNNISATIKNIENGSYPLVKDLYYVVNNPSKNEVKHFLTFLTSDTGINILRKTGHQVIHFDAEAL